MTRLAFTFLLTAALAASSSVTACSEHGDALTGASGARRTSDADDVDRLLSTTVSPVGPAMLHSELRSEGE